MSRLRIAFLVSGNGSTFQYIAERIQGGDLKAEAAVVISSNAKAKAIERAANLGIPSVVIRRTKPDTDDEFAQVMLRQLHAHQVNFVCLAGYLKLIPAAVIREFSGRITNVHPALLPAFGGKDMYGSAVHEAVIESGVRISGATIHLVDDLYDHGPIVAQQVVYVAPDDTPDSLAARIHKIETQLYHRTLVLFAEDRIQLTDNRVRILPES